jgi:gas vesicle protein
MSRQTFQLFFPFLKQEKDGEVIKTKSKEPVPSANQKKISKEKTKTEKTVPTQIEEEMKKFKSTIQNHISPLEQFKNIH